MLYSSALYPHQQGIPKSTPTKISNVDGMKITVAELPPVGEVAGGLEIKLLVPCGVVEPTRELEGVLVLLGMEDKGDMTIGLRLDMLGVADRLSVRAEEDDEATDGLSV